MIQCVVGLTRQYQILGSLARLDKFFYQEIFNSSPDISDLCPVTAMGLLSFIYFILFIYFRLHMAFMWDVNINYEVWVLL